MRKPKITVRIPLEAARSHWFRRQLLGGQGVGMQPAQVVEEAGWVRTLGGVDAYLSLRTRIPGLRREDVDRALERSDLQVIPAVRGCMYLLPKAHLPLALQLAASQSRGRIQREHGKVGITDGELDELGAGILGCLHDGPLSTDALRRGLPKGSIRSLGEAGKKMGISSTLPPALRRLEFSGAVERVLENGRLDGEKYLWRIPKENPLGLAERSEEDCNTALASLFFLQHGPASREDFAAWSGLGQRAARAAIQALPLVSVAVDGYAEEAWILEEELEALRRGEGGAGGGGGGDAVSFMPFLDNYTEIHGPGPITDPASHHVEVMSWGSSKPSTLGAANHVQMRCLLIGDRLEGFWEFDPGAEEVVFQSFQKQSAKTMREIEKRASELSSFISKEVGHGKRYILDSDAALGKRAAALRGTA